jgi:uncharacterized secreted protein with C-terminal beta-propeller domain
MKRLNILLIGLFLLVAGCSTGVTQPINPDATIKDGSVAYFSSQEQLQAMLSTASNNYYEPMMMRGDVMMAESADSTSSGSGDFAKTNNQEVGVDEADIFKTDGEYIYTSSGNSLFITSTGENTELLSSTNVNMSVQGLFIQDNTLLVIGSTYHNYGMERMIWPGPSSSEMIVKIYDVSNPVQPEEVKTIESEGYYVDARLKDGVAYIISNAQVTYDHPMPLIKINSVETTIPVDRIAYFPGEYDNPQMTTVHTIDIGSLSVESDGVLTESTQEVYMDQFLYLSSTEHINEWDVRQKQTIELAQQFLTQENKNLIARIQSTDNDILSSSEKKSKIQQVVYERIAELSQTQKDSFEDEVEVAVKNELDNYEYREYTNIAKFSVSADGIDAVASGQVAGRVYDSFGFDEVNDALRVVTTTSGVWEDGKMNRESENHVFALDSDLQELDSIHNIAPGESIFSARYTDERLYLVTFEQVDPFFVIDVSDNSNLEILGELKITGFSRYLHPVSDNVVLGLGREATETGRQQGLKMSLFDVSDVSNPREITKWVSEDRYASSTAEFEHKAFLMDVQKELLVIPVNNWQRDNQYSGAYVFSITEDSLELRGLVEHENQVERSTWIGSELYTKSFDLLRVNDLETLEGLVDIDLKQVSNTDVPVY